MTGVWSRLTRVLYDKYGFVAVYIDDICIFSKTNEFHIFARGLKCFAIKRYIRTEENAPLERKVSSSLATQFPEWNQASIRVRHQQLRKWSQQPREEVIELSKSRRVLRRFIYDFTKIALFLSQLVKDDVF